MNSKELFEEYTKEASNKMKWVSNKAKELGVSGSDVVFELLKSGFRLDELKRGNPTQYKSAQKKLDAWKKAGSPSDEDEDVLQRIKEENTESTQVEKKLEVNSDIESQEEPEHDAAVFYSGETVNELKTALEKKEKYIIELEGEKDELEDLNGKQAEHLVEVMDENTRLRERIRGLEAEVDEVQSTAKESAELKKLRENNKKLTETTNYMIQEYDKIAAEKKRCMKRIDELQAELNETTENFNESMAFNRKLEERVKISEGDLESEQEHLNSVYEENSILKQRLEKAERYILNGIYSQLEG